MLRCASLTQTSLVGTRLHGDGKFTHICSSIHVSQSTPTTHTHWYTTYIHTTSPQSINQSFNSIHTTETKHHNKETNKTPQQTTQTNKQS
jgi:Zn-dependent M28 family amino/carboxypeptidase